MEGGVLVALEEGEDEVRSMAADVAEAGVEAGAGAVVFFDFFLGTKMLIPEGPLVDAAAVVLGGVEGRGR